MIDHYGARIRLNFNRSCLKQSNNLTYDYGHKVNFYIVYELGASSFNGNDNDPTLKNCLFGAVTLTKNADVEKYGYSSFGIGFDRRSSFLCPGGGQNILIFGLDLSSSAPIDNKKKDTWVLGKGPTQGLEHTLTAEKNYSINFTVTNKKNCLSLHYNGANSYLFVNGTDIYKFKTKDCETFVGPICLGNISKDWLVDNMKKAGFTGHLYGFNVAYDATDVDYIVDIHKYLMKKIAKCKWKYLDLLKKCFW